MKATTPLLSVQEQMALLQHDDSDTFQPATIQVLCADPHPVVLEGLKKSFAHHREFGLIRCLTDGANTWREVLASKPDVLIMEMTLTGLSSMQLIRAVQESGCSTKIIVFTLASNPLWVEALAQGVQGLVSKTRTNEELMDAVRAVHQEKKWLDEEFSMANKVGRDWPLTHWALASRLTEREMSIVQALMRGASNRVIASELAIKEGTVKIHLKNVYRKMGCTNRVELLSRTRHPE